MNYMKKITDSNMVRNNIVDVKTKCINGDDE